MKNIRTALIVILAIMFAFSFTSCKHAQKPKASEQKAEDKKGGDDKKTEDVKKDDVKKDDVKKDDVKKDTTKKDLIIPDGEYTLTEKLEGMEDIKVVITTEGDKQTAKLKLPFVLDVMKEYAFEQAKLNVSEGEVKKDANEKVYIESIVTATIKKDKSAEQKITYAGKVYITAKDKLISFPELYKDTEGSRYILVYGDEQKEGAKPEEHRALVAIDKRDASWLIESEGKSFVHFGKDLTKYEVIFNQDMTLVLTKVEKPAATEPAPADPKPETAEPEQPATDPANPQPAADPAEPKPESTEPAVDDKPAAADEPKESVEPQSNESDKDDGGTPNPKKPCPTGKCPLKHSRIEPITSK